MLSDIEISQQNKLETIDKIAAKIGINAEDLDCYGKYKAKISFEKMQKINASSNSDGKLILITAITPTAAGEGKSTVSIGLADALCRLGKKAMLALREPSLGPCFGVKGGATGGGYSQIVPMEDINLHFTGDLHAITSANNLLASAIDNHIYHGNELDIDPKTISWKRCLDLNDRVLRDVEVGLTQSAARESRNEGFNITAASEVMAIFCMAKDINDLKNRLGNIVIGQTYDGRNVLAREFKVEGAMIALLRDAIKPNLVQTLEKTPALVHGGPFANIAHGCNTIIATKTALKLADYVVTEAGFGADLGAEKFLDIKCRAAGLKPSTIVVVATIRALKMHGGLDKSTLSEENVEALEKGFSNLKIHVENMQKYGVPVVVAVNKFSSDSEVEINKLLELTNTLGVKAVLSDGWASGGKGVEQLALEVIKTVENDNEFKFLYEDCLSLEDKIRTIAKSIYRAEDIELSEEAKQKLKNYTDNGYNLLPVCIAKTQNSISHDKKLVGAPTGYILPIRDVRLSAGAGFVVALAGDILTMPGLPKVPAAERIDVDENGIISGVF